MIRAYLALAVLAASIGFAGWQFTRAERFQAEFADYRAKTEAQERKRTDAARVAEQKTRIEQQEAQDEATRSNQRAIDDARSAGLAAGRLRERAAALATAARCPAPDSSLAASSPAAEAPADLLADLLGRVDEAAGEIGRYADQARIAGQLCVKSYEALEP